MAKAVRTSAARDQKNEAPASSTKRIERVLITQARPEGEKSPYFDLAKKFDLLLDFHPFIRVEGLSGKEFRRQKVDLNEYTAIVFTSRLAVDHFFRIMDEMKMKVNQELKYFCITEAVALYLQKFILYRKRKVFFSADGSTQGLLDVIGKHKSEKYVVPMADSTKKEIPAFLTKYKITFAEASLYRTVSNDLAPVLDKQEYDMIVFFSPYSIQALYDYNADYRQNGTILGAFGPTTTKAVEDAGLRLDIKAPAANAPSMVNAMELYLTNPAAFAPPPPAAEPEKPQPAAKEAPAPAKASSVKAKAPAKPAVAAPAKPKPATVKAPAKKAAPAAAKSTPATTATKTPVKAKAPVAPVKSKPTTIKAPAKKAAPAAAKSTPATTATKAPVKAKTPVKASVAPVKSAAKSTPAKPVPAAIKPTTTAVKATAPKASAPAKEKTASKAPAKKTIASPAVKSAPKKAYIPAVAVPEKKTPAKETTPKKAPEKEVAAKKNSGKKASGKKASGKKKS